VLVTLRARAEVDYLRRGEAFAAMARALSRANKAWFRIFAWSVQTDHVHLVVEADNRLALIRGVQGWRFVVPRR
jgi:REP element-mobilizing transposase RayT